MIVYDFFVKVMFLVTCLNRGRCRHFFSFPLYEMWLHCDNCYHFKYNFCTLSTVYSYTNGLPY